jgi:hypothetical protein
MVLVYQPILSNTTQSEYSRRLKLGHLTCQTSGASNTHHTSNLKTIHIVISLPASLVSVLLERNKEET